jgi:hypothetical protein
MHDIYTLQTILTRRMYGLKDVNNIMAVGYHGNDYLNLLEKLIVTKMPMLHKGKLI